MYRFVKQLGGHGDDDDEDEKEDEAHSLKSRVYVYQPDRATINATVSYTTVFESSLILAVDHFYSNRSVCVCVMCVVSLSSIYI